MATFPVQKWHQINRLDQCVCVCLCVWNQKLEMYNLKEYNKAGMSLFWCWYWNKSGEAVADNHMEWQVIVQAYCTALTMVKRLFVLNHFSINQTERETFYQRRRHGSLACVRVKPVESNCVCICLYQQWFINCEITHSEKSEGRKKLHRFN